MARRHEREGTFPSEWAKACNLRDGYWLSAIYDCATPSPRLVRVQDPFGNLLATAKGSVVMSARQALHSSIEFAEEGNDVK